jgi:hypothetical protein
MFLMFAQPNIQSGTDSRPGVPGFLPELRGTAILAAGFGGALDKVISWERKGKEMVKFSPRNRAAGFPACRFTGLSSPVCSGTDQARAQKQVANSGIFSPCGRRRQEAQIKGLPSAVLKLAYPGRQMRFLETESRAASGCGLNGEML